MNELLVASARRVFCAFRIQTFFLSRRMTLAVVLLAATQLAGLPLGARQPDRRGPRVPNAIRMMPGWASNALPFNGASYFRTVPPQTNAATEYLDAMFEFTDEVDVCFPEPAFTSRAAIARERMRRLGKVYSAFVEDHQSVDRSEIAAVLQDFRKGFAKLAEAQRRPTCLFERDIGFGAFSGHSTSLRQLTRVIELQNYLAIERGEWDQVARSVESLLRLSGDVRPRCDRKTLAEAAAADRICTLKIVRPALESPTVSVEFCKALAQSLRTRDSALTGAGIEVLKDDYLKIRRVLAELESNQFNAVQLADELKLNSERMTRGRLVCLLFNDLGGMPLNVRMLQTIMAEEAARDNRLEESLRRVRQDSKLEALMEKTWVGLWLDTVVASMTAGEFSFEIAALNEWYVQAENRLAEAPPMRRNRPLSTPAWERSKILRFFMPPPVEPLWEIEAENHAWLRCALVAVEFAAESRSRTGADDNSVISKITSILQSATDPFDGKPLRLGRRDGHAVVYSVGPDGVDDQARIEWSGAGIQGKGDLVFPLPVVRAK